MERSRAFPNGAVLIDGEMYAPLTDRERTFLDVIIQAQGERDQVRQQLEGAVDTLRERVMALGGMRRTDQGAFWIDRDDVLRLLDEIGGW